MRLALVTKRFDLIGGSERYAGAVARGLAERGHEVHVYCAAGEQDADAARTCLPALGADRPTRGECDALRAAVRGQAADVVYLLSSLAPRAFDALASAAPLVRHVQDHTLFCPGMNKVHEDGTNCREALGLRCLERYYLGAGCSGFKRDGGLALRRPLATLAARLDDVARHGRAAGLVCASRYMRDQLVLAGCAPDRVHTIPYFTRSSSEELPAEALDADLAAFLEHDDPLVFCPARLTLPDKGVDYLITALGALAQPFRCVVAGEGPAREWLERKARDEGLADRVRFAGWQGPGAVETLYRRARVVAFPSVWDEPFGLVGLEAAAHANPVVAFEVGGVVDWLADGETGSCVRNRDAAAFASALDAYLGDAQLADRVGARARDHVASAFSRDAHLCRLEAVLANAV
ncbi:MAG: glycosyltransferase family 4 protein [Planctomycetes bacterium]|nr:glycosyltransferase family 4 protein [Planctomycetota bacterium]MCB9903569.1 glycosyltransferase family 4 protein [Planctomycetota bacterium]